MNSEFKESSFKISLVITLIIYIIIILIFSLITFDDNEDSDFKSVYLEFNHFEKKISKNKKGNNYPRNFKLKNPPKDVKKQSISDLDKSTESETSINIIDSSLITKVDTLKNYSEFLDSIVIHNPSLLALKSALVEHFKNNSQIETDSAMIVRRMKKYMLEYYKNKFPTPLSKFGDPSPGIPIDKIVDLFSKKDTVDMKKIKKYLGLDNN